MNYDFIIDTEQLLTLKSELESKVSILNGSIEGIYTAIKSMGEEDWQDDVYVTLETKTKAYEESLNYAVNYMSSYASLINKTVERAVQLGSDITDICNR